MNAEVKFRIKGTKVYVDPVNRPRAQAAYEGASVANRLRNWNVNSGGPNTVIGGSLSTLRSRSRDVARKNGVADGALEILVSNIIGTGIKPQFVTADKALNAELAKLWTAWTNESDADARFDFYGQQGLAVRGMLEAGDVFARMRARRAGDVRTVPLQIQLLESEFCPVEKTEQSGNGRNIVNGVEFDAIGRRTAYWLYRDHPQDINSRGDSPVPVPAADVVHMAQTRRPGMVRGEPWLTRALIKLYDLDQYDDAQLQRQKVAAMFAGFMTPNADGKFGYQDDADADGVSLAALEPATLQVIDPGASMTFTTPPSPGDSYSDFMRQQLRHVAGSMGILYEDLTGDFSQVNDRTWRAAVNGFRRRLERWQHSTVVFQFCLPILRRWTELGILSGRIALPSGVEVEDVVQAKWIPQAHSYINPVQDIQAQREEVRAGFKSRSEIVSSRGYDAEQVDAEIAADNARADSLELRFDSDGRTDQKGTVPSEDQQAATGFQNDTAKTTARAFELFGEASKVQAEAARLQAEKPPVNLHMPEIKVPDIVARIEMPEQKAPIVNIAPAQVTVAPAAVHVAAPEVNVTVSPPPEQDSETEVTAYDNRGRIKNFVKRFIAKKGSK